MLRRLEESFATHTFIDFFYDMLHEGVLPEIHDKGTDALLESYGLFDGCDNIVWTLWGHIVERLAFEDYSPLTIPIDNSSFIDTVQCIFEKQPGGGDAAYDRKNSVIENGKFNPLIIRLSTKPEIQEYIQPLICHELTHAYEDYSRRKRHKSLDSEISKLRYEPTVNAMEQNSTPLVREIATLLYLFSSFERNAYVAQIKAELLYCKKEFNDVHDVVDFLRNTNTYRKYQEMLSLADAVIKVTDPEKQKSVLSLIRLFSSHRFSNYKAFCKWVNLTARRIDKKLKTLIPKMANEYLSFDRHILLY